MGAHIVEKGKTPDSSPGVISLPAPDVEAVHVLRYRQLQEEHEAKMKKIIAELEERQDVLQKKLEASLAEQERRLTEELQAKHMAEYRRLELTAVDREHALLVKLNVARRRLVIAVIGALLVIVAILNFRTVPQDAVLPLSGEASAPEVVAALLPHLSAPEVVVTKPSIGIVGEGSSQAAGVEKKAGNGGNFLRGSM
jgi:hypothetical protein